MEKNKNKLEKNTIDTKNINSNVRITKEEAAKRAEALLMTHTDTTTKPNGSKVLVASVTLLVVVICAFIILLIS